MNNISRSNISYNYVKLRVTKRACYTDLLYAVCIKGVWNQNTLAIGHMPPLDK